MGVRWIERSRVARWIPGVVLVVWVILVLGDLIHETHQDVANAKPGEAFHSPAAEYLALFLVVLALVALQEVATQRWKRRRRAKRARRYQSGDRGKT